MDVEGVTQAWETAAKDVFTALANWRAARPRATVREIEVALDEQLAALRARMLEHLAQTDVWMLLPEERPTRWRIPSHDEHFDALARAVSEARRGRLTLTELAQRAGVSPSVISEIERGRANPSLGTLLKVADALGLSVSDFFQSPANVPTLRPVVRQGEHPHITFPASGVIYELLTPKLLPEFVVIRSRVPPGFSNEEQPSAHPGWECALMVSGRMEHHQNGEVYVLEEGDSITFDASSAHWIANPGPEWVEFIDVQTPSSII